MHPFLSLMMIMAISFFSLIANAQDVSIQWKDLSAAERQNILNTWRALPQAEKGPFMLYRQKAIKNLSEEKKQQYTTIAEEREAREAALEKAYQKRQAAEEEARAITEKLKPNAPEPIINDIAQPEAITPIDTTPAVNADPANANSTEAEKQEHKIKGLLENFF